MYNGKLIRYYHREKTRTTCSIYAQKNRYKFVEHDWYSTKPIKVAYVDRPFPTIDYNESEIQFGLELMGFTDWSFFSHANPCLGFAEQKDGVIHYYFSAYEGSISEDEYVSNFAKHGLLRTV